MMDPANQSLADALRILYRLIQFAVVVLGVLYVFSGFQSVKENEQGIRLLFGARQGDRLEPGFRFSYPPPLGELVKVDTGEVTLDLSTDFWVYLDEGAKNLPTDQLPGLGTVNPERDSAVITADGNLAHTRWRVQYRRDPLTAVDYAQNILPGDQHEKKFVTFAVRRAVVQAIARVTIDDLLKQASGETGSVAAYAKDIAQHHLDSLKSGLRISKLILVEKIPPPSQREKFAQVQAAESTASKTREEAVASGQRNLSETAGGAAPTLAALIEKYEVAIEKRDSATAERILAQIDGVMEGSALEFEGLSLAAGKVSGQVAATMASARQYRSDVVNQRRSELSTYQAKLSQFKSSPSVMIHREWADAVGTLMARDYVQTMLMPPGIGVVQLNLNADPSILRELDKASKRAEVERTQEERDRQRREERFRVDSSVGITAKPK